MPAFQPSPCIIWQLMKLITSNKKPPQKRGGFQQQKKTLKSFQQIRVKG